MRNLIRLAAGLALAASAVAIPVAAHAGIIFNGIDIANVGITMTALD
ncbi:MAG TPA: hypothetical protein VH419_04285 [Nocardioidaceae bacterium]|jgi:hypothetical protein